VVMEKKPEIMLIGATTIGRDLGPRSAATLHTRLYDTLRQAAERNKPIETECD